ncbi:MAG: dTDP-4-dehydrorhamnose reductase [Oligoflexia bacterium]|nr:dTDP-4-dehydrorhamnose reductase [Oligoflexia bacterium]
MCKGAVLMIWVVGVEGQLGHELKCLLTSESLERESVFTAVHECDITKIDTIRAVVKKHPAIKTIVNCAAYTAVEKAGEESQRAFAVNSEGPGNLAKVAAEFDLTLFHISTDYIFSGKHFTPYKEEDDASPLSAYGASKWQGELAVRAFASRSVVIRTSWLYSSYGHNFVKIILEKAKKSADANANVNNGNLRVVYDQIGSPTFAGDLAAAILEISKRELQGHAIYNYTNEGITSWYDFAKAIVEIEGIECEITPILSSEYPSKVERPMYSVLNKSKIKQEIGIKIPHWRESLKRCLCQIQKRS